MSKRGLLSDDEMEALLAEADDGGADDGLDTGIDSGLLFTPHDFADFCDCVAPLLLDPVASLSPLVDAPLSLEEPQLALISPDALKNPSDVRLLLVSLNLLGGVNEDTLLELPGPLARRLALRMIGGDDKGDDDVDDVHVGSLYELFRQFRNLLSKTVPEVFPPSIKKGGRPRKPVISGRKSGNRLLKRLFGKEDHLVAVSALCRINKCEAGNFRFIFSVDTSRELLSRTRKLLAQVENERTSVRNTDENEVQTLSGALRRTGGHKEVSGKQDGRHRDSYEDPACILPGHDQAAVGHSSSEQPGNDPVAGHSGEASVRRVARSIVAALGRAMLDTSDAKSISPGAVIKLDKAAGEEIDLLIDGRKVGRGEVVVVDDCYAVKVAAFDASVLNGGA